MGNIEYPASGAKEGSRPFLLSYACALGSVALATMVRRLFDPVLGDPLRAYGGIRPALATIAMGACSIDLNLEEA
ncbi:MAG: hypothetical protein ABI822_20630, partial [Bryobacteraceae bacterium]